MYFGRKGIYAYRDIIQKAMEAEYNDTVFFSPVMVMYYLHLTCPCCQNYISNDQVFGYFIQHNLKIQFHGDAQSKFYIPYFGSYLS